MPVKMNKKLNESFLKQINDLKASRNGVDRCYINFILNMGRHVSFTENMLKEDMSLYDEQIVIEHSIIAMVSCWETFFRDVFIYIINEDKNSRESLFNQLDEERKEVLNNLGIIEDYFSKLYNFQNIEHIKTAFNALLDIELFNEIGSYFIPYLKDGIIYKFSMDASLNDWFQAIVIVFNERHKIIHDANYRTNLNRSIIKACENVFLCFPQIFCHWIANKYSNNLDIMILSLLDGTICKKNSMDNSQSIPALLTRDWVIGKWYIID